MTVFQTDTAPKLSAPKAAPKAEKVAAEEVAEPKKREDKRSAEPTPKRDLKAVMGDWSTDDE